VLVEVQLAKVDAFSETQDRCGDDLLFIPSHIFIRADDRAVEVGFKNLGLLGLKT